MSLLRRSASLLPAAALVLALLAPAGHAHAQKIDLKPKLSPDQEFSFRIESTGKTEVTNADPNAQKAPPQLIDQDMVLKFKVLETSETGSKVDATFQSIKVKMDMGGSVHQFDSTTPAKDAGNEPLAASFSKLVGYTLHLTLDPAGKITDIQSDPAGLPPGPMGQFAQDLITKDTAGFRLGQIFSTSDEPQTVGVGDSWDRKAEFNTRMGKRTINAKHTVKKIEANAAHVDVTGNVTQELSGLGAAANLKDSFFKGNYVWDGAAGMLRTMTIDQSLTMEISLAGSSNSVVSSGSTKFTKLD